MVLSERGSANVRISIGKAYEAMPPERRAATEQFAEDLRRWGLTVDLEVIEYVPGRVGLTPVEWTSIFVGTSVGTKLLGNLTDDLYNAAKELLRRRWQVRKQEGRTGRHLGFTIYGPDGRELRQWSTREDDEDPTRGRHSRMPSAPG